MPPDVLAGFLPLIRVDDADAAAVLFRQFTRRLIGVARSRLGPTIRRKVDPEDVLQSVWKSFFRREADGEFQLESWDSVWSLLVVITVRKCGRKADEFYAACRDVRREASLDASASAGWVAVGLEPSPSEAAALVETAQRLLSSLVGVDRQILECYLQTYSVAQTALQVGRSERTVRRLLEKVRLWLECEARR